jgi:hypothetical protein
MPRREDLAQALVFGPPLGVVLALLGCIALAFANLVDATPLAAGFRELVPLLRLIHACDLVPLVIALAFASGFGLVLAARIHARTVASGEG